MLSYLSIRNLALIDNLTIEFGDGLNILTGETGAGKSIIIDAVGLILGERADKEMIQTGKDFARIEGLFYLKKPEKIIPFLERYGIQTQEDGSLLLTRQLSRSGRNICRINGQAVTLSVLKELGQQLVDIHGQHQHQSLLNPEYHIEILDRLGGEPLAGCRQTVNSLYSRWKSILHEIDMISKSERDSERMKDLLSYQINEIENARLKPGEDDELMQERALLQNAEKINQVINEAYDVLYSGAERGMAVFDQVAVVKERLDQISGLNEMFAGISHDIDNIYYQIEDVIDKIRTCRDSFDYNPDRLDDIENRLVLLNSLKRKYGDTIEEILELQKKLKSELLSVETRQDRLEELNRQEKEVYNKLVEACTGLSRMRRATARIFEQRVIEQLSQLGMEKTMFEVAISTPDDSADYASFITSQGFDKIEFTISPNLGEPLKPLARIISGGEMSRVMLAFKTVLAGIDDIPILIFDEIDAGISGRIASVVGEKMSSLSQSHQVVCVTHLPQIAVMADVHYRIEKRVEDNHTHTFVSLLDENERQEEIARLIGGAEISKIGLEHARELIDTAKEMKEAIS
jgi:DNA repair protein RecN (Recombination protein N)